MKNVIFIFSTLLFVGISSSALAQFSIGARVAGNLSKVVQSGFDDEEEMDFDNRFGMAFGLVTEIGISNMFAIQAEVLYSQLGAGTSGTETFDLFGEVYTYKWDDKIRFNYLQIPLLAKLKFGTDNLGINAFVGPHIGFGLGKVVYDYDYTFSIGGVVDEADKGTDKEDWDDLELNKFDYGVTGGLGISFPVGTGTLGIDARYQLGLGNLVKEPEGDEKGSHRNIQFGLSYLLPIGN